MSDRQTIGIVLLAAGVAAAALTYTVATAGGPGGSSGGQGGASADAAQPGSSAGLIATALYGLENLLADIGMYTPRGIRNNNPGNLRFEASVPWDGQTGSDPGGYAVFSAPMWGVRALAHQLMDYANRGATTVAAIVSRWAPPTENNTAAYISDVAGQLGVDPNATLDVQAELPALAAAIIQHENGEQPYNAADLQQWVYMA